MSNINFKPSTIWTGDNLEVMRGMNDACIDLIYLDPPFCSQAEYQAPIGSDAEGAKFLDIWHMDLIKHEEHGELAERHPALYAAIDAAQATHGQAMRAYLIFMGLRLMEMRRILKPTGSIYLHCDPTASHYLKMVLDAVFGKEGFRNEVLWCYTRMSCKGQRQFSRAHDCLLWYSNGSEWTFNVDPVRLPYAAGSKAREGHTLNRLGSGYSKEGVTKLNPLGKFPENWITHIPYLRGSERCGYPTQKPLALLRRIIEASSNEGDIVFDPFCGCATALVAAATLNRQWVGCDVSPLAVKLLKKRLLETADLATECKPNALKTAPTRTDIRQEAPKQSIKRFLYGKQGGICNGCELHFPFKVCDRDHIIPLSRGGQDTLENSQILCHHCNIEKGNKTMAEWRAWQKKRDGELLKGVA